MVKQQRKMALTAPPLSPTLLRETINKVDKCMARLQELQYTVSGGTKMISGVSLSPRSTRSYLRTSLRCKQESLRIKNSNSRRSPPGKLPTNNTEEWRRMSLPAMLLGETMGEIVKASQFARNIVEAVVVRSESTNNNKTRKLPPSENLIDDLTTPVKDNRRKQKPKAENSELLARRKREKQQALRSEEGGGCDVVATSSSLKMRRAKSRINFKGCSPPPPPPPQLQQTRDSSCCDKENCRSNSNSKYVAANRVSPRNRPWARKTVLFPNPLFHSSPTSQHHHHKLLFSKTNSPVVIARNRQTTTTPHKFLIKSPAPPSKFQVKIKSPPLLSISPTRAAHKRSSPPKAKAVGGGGGGLSNKLRRSFSPSRLANKIVSPLKSRKSSSSVVQKKKKNEEGMKMMTMMSGLKQRPTSFSLRFSPRRI